MLESLRRPLSIPAQVRAVGACAVAVALYCLTYTWLAGAPESPSQALAWALANVCPWLAAIEAGKRAQRIAEWLGVLAAALIVSLGLGYMLGASADPFAFEAIRRLPALIAASAAIALLRSAVGQKPRCQQMKLLPRQIDWVRAAGNYVEIRGAGRTLVQRASIGSVERELARHGFVRIHRSMLVRRERIARVRANDVVLHDGTHLPVGKSYRAALAG
jgi:hypothetical protein